MTEKDSHKLHLKIIIMLIIIVIILRNNDNSNNNNRLWQTRIDGSYQIPEPPVMKVTFINGRGKVSYPIITRFSMADV